MSDGRYPAFPVVGGQTVYAHGMTLRDWFAGQALAGIGILEVGKNTDPDAMAATSYDIADAMIEARDK